MLIELPYQRDRAVAYALRWARSRNPLFPDYAGQGGDCTNFVSQSILAGTCVMNPTPDFGWYYFSPIDRAPAWTGVQFFYDFITGAPPFAGENGGVGPFGREVARDEVELGDVVQLANREGRFYHTLIVTDFNEDEILVSAHTDDAENRALSTYRYASLRYLHIEGTRLMFDNEDCYRRLLEGEAYVPTECAGGEAILLPAGGGRDFRGTPEDSDTPRAELPGE